MGLAPIRGCGRGGIRVPSGPAREPAIWEGSQVPETLLIVLLVLLLLAVFFGGWGYRRYGGVSWTPIAVVLLIILLLALAGRL